MTIILDSICDMHVAKSSAKLLLEKLIKLKTLCPKLWHKNPPASLSLGAKPR